MLLDWYGLLRLKSVYEFLVWTTRLIVLHSGPIISEAEATIQESASGSYCKSENDAPRHESSMVIDSRDVATGKRSQTSKYKLNSWLNLG
jgi:hypothetical protein